MKRLTKEQMETLIRLEALGAVLKEMDASVSATEQKLSKLMRVNSDPAAVQSPDEEIRRLRDEIDAAVAALRKDLDTIGREILEAAPVSSMH